MKKSKTLLSLQIKTEADVVLARRRARQIAFLLGFEPHDLTRISTAVSEITRNAFIHAKGGRLEFGIADSARPYSLVVTLQDRGPGFDKIDEIMNGRSENLGLVGARRLVDQFIIENVDGGGARVQLEKEMKLRIKPFSDSELNELANSLTKIVSLNPIDEVHQQNQELLSALDQLSQKQQELDLLNSQLAEKNKHLSEVNSQISVLNDSLEEKVQSRTSELQQLNAELLTARDEAILANKLKSQFVANISHEIRTPMSGILSSTELVLDSSNLSTDDQELVRMAHDSARGLMGIINDLLDFAKLEAGRPRLEESNFYFASVMDEVVETVSGAAKKKELQLSESMDEALSAKLFVGDHVLIKRCLVNLAHNAVKFTPTGEVKIEFKVVDQKPDVWQVRGIVTDSGIGIDDADKKRLFQPFVQADGTNTRRYGGTGLGLSISSGYISLMGGQMGFESKKDQGSQFWFTIPVKLAAR